MSVLESGWLQEVILLSLKASSTSPPPRNGDPGRSKLAEGIVRSRRLVPTYNFVLLGFVILVASTHWTQKAIRWKRWRVSILGRVSEQEVYGTATTGALLDNSDQDVKYVYSSSRSAVDVTVSPAAKAISGEDQDEESPLLHSRRSTQSSWKSIAPHFKALWTYQPPPIPVVNKVLPPNGTSFSILAFMALNVFYTFYQINFNLSELFVLADRCGVVFVVNLPLLYLLAAKTQPLKLLTGRSYESLNIFHRRLGELLCLEASLHSAGMIGAWYVILRPSGFGLIRFLLLKTIILGLGALFAYEMLYFTSMASFRARWYELFLLSHIVLQIAGLVFLYFHHIFARQYVLIALAIFFADRLVYRLGIKRITVEAETKILEDEDTVRLSATIPRQPSSIFSSIFGHSLKAGWQATDHIFLTVPSLSNRHIIQAHPFTIASPAPSPEAGEGRMHLLIRAQDGFSRDLLNAARLHKHLNIHIDGPYGSSHAGDMLESSDLAILVAGGSGIAVCWPLLHHLLHAQSRNSYPSSYSSPHSSFDPETNTTQHIPFASRAQKIILIWIIHESTHLSWLGRPGLQDADYQGVEIIIPRATGEVGRPDLRSMIHELVDLYAGESVGQKSKRIRVVASGPDGMGRAVRNTCAALVGKGRNVDVCVEKFGW